MSKNYEELYQELLEKVKQLEDENQKLKHKKRYGLVWEEHEEENLNPNTFPMLEEVKEREIKSGGEDHILIEGDNYDSLRSLLYTHKGKIDVIYIDPPYNTGNKDFVYNDRFVDKEDTYKHSKWLSFMNRRLKLARELLSEEGVIFISIDEHEFAQLKILCDSIFGEENFLTNITWYKNNSKGNSKIISTVTEYIMSYSKNKHKMGKLLIEKPKALEMIRKSKQIFQENLSLHEKNKKFREWLRSQEVSGGERKYNSIDENGDLYTDKPLTAPGSKQYYDIIHPVTGKPCKKASSGWRYKEDRMKDMISKGEILFGKDENKVPSRKYLLKENINQVMTNHVKLTANNAKDLIDIGISKEKFSYPKPLNLIKHLLSPSKNATILDFFAGSGTTGHAVLDLNKEDGGNRKFILCTNNENKIAEEVTYERLKRVINGYTTPKGKEVEGLPGSLRYYKTKQIGDVSSPTKKDIKEVINHLEHILKIKHGTFNEIVINDKYSFFDNKTDVLVYIKNIFEIDNIIESLKGNDKQKNFYIVSHDTETMEKIKEKTTKELENVHFHQIPEEIRKFFKNLEKY